MVMRIKRFRRGRPSPNLSATFRHGGLTHGGGSVTLDETLALIESEQKRRRLLKARAAERAALPGGAPQTPAQRQALATLHAQRVTKSGRIKMPVVHIQTIDVDKIGAR
jgi:hypothetical protein